MVNDMETKIIKKAAKGDKDAFEKLIIKYEKRVYNIAYQMFGNEHDAMDVAQDVFIKVYQSLHKFNNKSAFSTWLHRITVNTCIDAHRKRKKDKQVESIDETRENDDGVLTKQYVDKGLTPEEAAIKKENIMMVREAIDSLKEDHKAIIILRDIKGYSYDEIADILEVSIGTVKSRIARARSQLKNSILEKREQNDDHFV